MNKPFLDSEINTDLNWRLVDKKVLFTKKLELSNDNSDIEEYKSIKHSYQELLDLTYLSGNSSRFFQDANFNNNEFEKLYKEWIDKSISNEIAFKVLIKSINNKIAGFVTLGKDDDETSQIGLIAVNKLFQGRNIATSLIKECENLSLQKGYSKLNVTTQLNNKAAIKLYKRNNFRINSIKYIYHFWNYDTI